MSLFSEFKRQKKHSHNVTQLGPPGWYVKELGQDPNTMLWFCTICKQDDTECISVSECDTIFSALKII